MLADAKKSSTVTGQSHQEFLQLSQKASQSVASGDFYSNMSQVEAFVSAAQAKLVGKKLVECARVKSDIVGLQGVIRQFSMMPIAARKTAVTIKKDREIPLATVIPSMINNITVAIIDPNNTRLQLENQLITQTYRSTFQKIEEALGADFIKTYVKTNKIQWKLSADIESGKCCVMDGKLLDDQEKALYGASLSAAGFLVDFEQAEPTGWYLIVKDIEGRRAIVQRAMLKPLPVTEVEVLENLKNPDERELYILLMDAVNSTQPETMARDFMHVHAFIVKAKTLLNDLLKKSKTHGSISVSLAELEASLKQLKTYDEGNLTLSSLDLLYLKGSIVTAMDDIYLSIFPSKGSQYNKKIDEAIQKANNVFFREVNALFLSPHSPLQEASWQWRVSPDKNGKSLRMVKKFISEGPDFKQPSKWTDGREWYRKRLETGTYYYHFEPAETKKNDDEKNDDQKGESQKNGQGQRKLWTLVIEDVDHKLHPAKKPGEQPHSLNPALAATGDIKSAPAEVAKNDKSNTHAVAKDNSATIMSASSSASTSTSTSVSAAALGNPVSFKDPISSQPKASASNSNDSKDKGEDENTKQADLIDGSAAESFSSPVAEHLSKLRL